MTEMEILQTTTDPIEMDMGDPVIEYSPVYPNPVGDPTDDLTKVQIQGDIYKVKDPEVHDWARAEEKPTYTKDEVGLGNVDDTSDMDKPVSTATQTALDNKVDKVAGKGLSTNDFTNDFKTKLEGIEAGAEVNTVNSVAGKTGNVTLDKSDVGLGNVDNTSDMNKPVSTATQTALSGKVDNSTLNNYYTKTQTDSALSLKADSSSVYTKTEADNLLNGKVDKVEGYGLSENDFTDTLKSKLDGIEAEANKTIVDTEISATSTNPLQNKAIYDLLNDLLPEAEETGNPIAISNASGFNAKALTVDMLPIQDLHGYDKPWAGGSGKNLINPDTMLAGYFTSTGSIGTQGNIPQEFYSPEYYEISGNSKISVGYFAFQTDEEPWISICWYDTNKTFISRNATSGGNSSSWDVPSNAVYFRCSMRTYGHGKEYCYSAKGEDLTFAPYSNICPISGYNSLAITVNGKNLFDKTKITTQTSTTIDYARTNGGIILYGGITYTISLNKAMSSIGVYGYGGEVEAGNRIAYSSSAQTLTFTPSETTKAFIRFYNDTASGGITETEVNSMQIEVGSTATTYEPYKVIDTETINFGETVYGGTCDVVNGGTSSIMAIVDLDDLSWTLGTLDRWTNKSLRNVIKIVSNSQLANLKAEQYKTYTNDQIYLNTSIIGICVDSEGSVKVRNGSTTEKPHGKIAYELATPTTINTPANEISLLKGNNTIVGEGDMELIYSKLPQ